MQSFKYKQLNMPYALSKKTRATTTNESQKQTKAQRNKVSKKQNQNVIPKTKDKRILPCNITGKTKNVQCERKPLTHLWMYLT